MNKETEDFIEANKKVFQKDCVMIVQALIDFADDHKLTTESEFRGMLHSFKEAYENPIFKEENMTAERYHAEASADHFTGNQF